MRALTLASILLYGLTSLIYLAHLFTRADRIRQVGRLATALLLVVHFATIGSYCVNGFHPLVGVGGTLNLIAFLLLAGFLLVSLRWPLPVGGAVIVPLAMALVISGQITSRGPPPGGLPAALGKLHLTLVAMGVAALALASTVAVVYLRQNLALRRNQLLALDSSAPALTTLDTLSLRLTLVGFPLFLCAVITGVLWSQQLGSGFRFEHLLAGVILLVYLVLMAARVTVGLRGRRAALLTLLGFAVTVAVLGIYVARRVLG
jgi:ABC-type uncharacterized transport system permease subunit